VTDTGCKCDLCEKPAIKRFTWVNDAGSGIGGGQQGGPMYEACMEFMWDALSRFPNARETTTIWPLEVVA
jgi:hypothetical protein